MIYPILIGLTIFFIAGSMFFRERKFFKKSHFFVFIVFNLIVAAYFVLQYTYSSPRLMVLTFDELIRVIPGYFLENMKVIIIQVLFNFTYFIFHARKKLTF